MRTTSAYLLLSVALIACAPDRSALNKLVDETMKVHDEGMVKMTEMKRLGRTLREELSMADSLSLSEGRQDSLTAALAAMTKAEEGMMAWMAGYKEPDVNMNMEESMNSMNRFKKDIDQNFEDMVRALDAANNLLK
jgi:hypothetical protein